MEIIIPVSPGELIDKITILEIKSVKIKDKKKLTKLNNELKLLNKYFHSNLFRAKKTQLNRLKKQLQSINLKLWNIEDRLRKLEAGKNFGKSFIRVARSVYFINDKRFELKNNINELIGSNISEVKEYIRYK